MGSDDMMPGILLHELMRARHNEVHACLAAQGLADLGAPMILFALKHCGQEGEIAVQRELSDVLHISPATVTVSLKSMERIGYIEKRPDAADARRKRIALTTKGAEAVEMCRAVFRAVDERMLCGLSGEEIGYLMSCLQKMLTNLRGDETPKIPVERKDSLCSKN